MKPANLVRIAFQSIRRNKMRTGLTMLGVVIGVAAVMIMVAIGTGARTEIRARIDNLGTNLIVITPGSSNQGGVSGGAGSYNRLKVEDADLLARESVFLAGVSPMIIAPTQAVGGEGNWRTAVTGVSADYLSIRDWNVASGATFSEEDLRASRKVALLGATVAEALFPGQDPVGSQIRLRNVPFTVIGLLEKKGQTADGADQDDVILAPYTTVQNRLSGRQFIPQILAAAVSAEDLPAAQDEVRVLMREAHGLTGPGNADDFTVRNQTDLAETAEQTTQVMSLLLAAIAGVSLLVGGIGIMNIMLVSVTERTREIGIRMAVGARSTDVLSQFLVESVILSGIAGMIGVLVGIGGSAMLSRATGWSTAVGPQTTLVALGFSAMVGVFFGFYPARKASKLNPIEALRYE